jgi:gliding motility-associated-like protein
VEITNDTLICTVDTLQLKALAAGNVVWSPGYMIDNITSHTPLVSPDVTTTYQVTATDQFGCKGTDSVRVKVVDHVTQFAPKDSTICQGDAIVLNLVSDALYYTWTPDNGSIENATVQSPTVRPLITTTYHVVGSISKKCFAEDNITVKPIPYPSPHVGPDINVCLGNSTQLHASGAAYYNWSPAIYLSATNVADPMVNHPLTGVRYIVSARDTLGCPKTVRDTILVKVISIKADAGNDTSVVIGQPLQLHATGGTHYQWDPGNWLSSSNAPDPIALPQDDVRYTVTVSDDNGCVGTDDIMVKYYKLAPGAYLPNAFTPNGDGKNDRFEPIELGLKSLEIFQIYNRWGKLIYQTSDMNKGWDGKLNGNPQEPATYVWYAAGTDYTGKKVTKKGTVILIK